MTNKLPPYTYKDFETGKIRKTRGRFQGWTKPTGLMNVRYAIFKNPRGDVLVPEPLLTPETKNRIGKADEPEAITPKPPAGSGLQMQSSFGDGGGQTYFAGSSPKRKGKKAAKANPKKKEKKGSGSLAAFGVMPEGQAMLPTVDEKKLKNIVAPTTDHDVLWEKWCEKDDKARGSIKRVKLEYGVGSISIHAPYNKRFTKQIKTIRGSVWNPKKKCWTIPTSFLPELQAIIRECYK